VGSEVRKRELNRRVDDDSDEELKPTVSYPGQKTYDISYDKLVIAVGCGTATFGIEGVAAHSFMLKDADDAQKIRSRIIECFELASQPTLSDEERRGILHFAVVGGGPTGEQIRFSGVGGG
jgi:NADH dehydrogenase FAD-containing subunit